MYRQTSNLFQTEDHYTQQSNQGDIFCDLKADDYFNFGLDLEKNPSNPCFSAFDSLCDLDGSTENQSLASEQKLSNLSSCTKKISKTFTIHKNVNRNSNLENEQTSKICSQKSKQVRWKAAEDEKVLNLIRRFGEKWTVISKILGNRTGKQIRDRYNNYLRANINNSKFTSQEDACLLELLAELGPKWAKIADRIPGRKENQVKNRYYGHLKNTVKSGDSTSPRSEATNLEISMRDEASERESRCSEIIDNSINIVSYSPQEEMYNRENDNFIKYAKMALGEEQENYTIQTDRGNKTIGQQNGSKGDKYARFAGVEIKKRIEELTKKKEALEHFYGKIISELNGCKHY